nr:thiamine phosphate synthase [Flexivirga aerilata]
MMLVTDRRQVGRRRLTDVVGACVAGGIRNVFLRERDLPQAEYDEVLATMRRDIADRAAIFTRSPDPRAAGCQLSSSDRLPSPRPPIVGRSAHDADELRRAIDEGLDYVFAGPYAESASKPGHGPALGARGIEAFVRLPGAPPVIAIGGVRPADAPDIASAGGHGIAVMGPLMRATDPTDLAAEYSRAAAVFVGVPHPSEPM